MPRQLPASGDVSRPAGAATEDSHGSLSCKFDVETILAGSEDLEMLAPESARRKQARLVAQPCRAIPVQLLNPEGKPCGDRVFADILDISLGGLCLLVTGDYVLKIGQDLVIDSKVFSTGDERRILGLVRWFVRSGIVTTMGVGFREPLEEMPQLFPERRNPERDSNAVAKRASLSSHLPPPSAS